jgi:hypothetical protein
VEVVNDTGTELRNVSVSLGGTCASWESIPRGESVSRRMQLPGGGPGAVSFTAADYARTDSVNLPDSTDRASSITVVISGSSTSLRYSF